MPPPCRNTTNPSRPFLTTSKHFNVGILALLCTKISMAALEKTYTQYQKANDIYTKKQLRASLGRCTHQFRMQMDLPRVHEVLNRLNYKKPFCLEDIGLHWHIEESGFNTKGPGHDFNDKEVGLATYDGQVPGAGPSHRSYTWAAAFGEFYLFA